MRNSPRASGSQKRYFPYRERVTHGAFFIFIGKFYFHTLTYHAISYEIKKNPASRILFYSLFRCNVSLCFQKLCAEHCTARGAAHGIVGQSHELPVIDRVLSQTSYRDTHTVLIVDIRAICGRLSSSRYWIKCSGALGSFNSCGTPLKLRSASIKFALLSGSS